MAPGNYTYQECIVFIFIHNCWLTCPACNSGCDSSYDHIGKSLQYKKKKLQFGFYRPDEYLLAFCGFFMDIFIDFSGNDKVIQCENMKMTEYENCGTGDSNCYGKDQQLNN